MISDWSVFKSKDWSFSVMSSAHIVKVFIQKGPYLPWKPCIQVKKNCNIIWNIIYYCLKQVPDHLSF